MKNSSFRIHLSYSDRHFYPNRENRKTEWFSCSQIAFHMWKALQTDYVNVTYGDTVPGEKIDLLWTNRSGAWHPQVSRMATFASIAHFGFVTQKIAQNKSWATDLPIEGLYSISDRWKNWLCLSRSDLILIIGNDHIYKSFNIQKPCGELHLLNCGIDTDHFNHSGEVIRKPIFIHNVTRFSVRKGSHIVAGAWKKVAEKLPDMQLVLMGRNGDVNVHKLLENVCNVNMLGEYQSGSKKYIQQLSSSRWVIQPSLAEGQAGTLLEAMSCGCIPIASKGSGVEVEKYGGYPLNDNSIDSLVDTILLAAKNWNSLQNSYVRKKTTEYHNWELFEQQFLELTKSLLEKSSNTHPSILNTFANFLFHILLSSRKD